MGLIDSATNGATEVPGTSADVPLTAKIEARIRDFEMRAATLPAVAAAQARSAYETCAALLRHDLSDGVCRCVRNNGDPNGRFVDVQTNLWCLHGKNQDPSNFEHPETHVQTRQRTR